MDDNTRSELKRAYKLIKANQKSEALTLLRAVVQREPENVDAWWLAAFAAPSPDKAIQACQKVLSLKPDHPVAEQFLTEQQELRAAASPSSSQIFPILEGVPRKQKKTLFTSRTLIFVIAILSIIAALTYGLPLLFGINWNQVIAKLPLVGQFMPTARPTLLVATKTNPIFPSLPPGVQAGSQNDNVEVVKPDQPAVGSVEVGKADDYRFYGTKFAPLLVIVKFLLPLNSSKALLLLGPDGAPVASSYVEMGAGTARLDYTLPQDGYYVLRIIGVEGVAQGGYALQIQIAP